MKSKRMTDDPVVDRVRAAGAKLAKDCGYDVEKLCRALMDREKRSRRRYASPKSPAKVSRCTRAHIMPRTPTLAAGHAVDRVRAAREALAKDYDYDIEKFGRAIMKLQAKSKRRYWTPKKKAARA